MDRRDFLEKSIAAVVLTYMQGCASSFSDRSKLSNQRLAYILCGDGQEDLERVNGTYRLNTPSDNTRIAVVSMRDGVTNYINTPGKGHEIVLNPINRSIAFAASKWGQDAFLVDIEKRVLLKAVKTDKVSLQFFGHGVFSSDGTRIYCTMYDHAKYEGFISVRDSKTLEEISRISTYGVEPHQVRWHIMDKVLCVINDRKVHARSPKNNSSLSFINVGDGGLVESLPFHFDRHSHFTIIETKGIVCRSSSKDESEHLIEGFDLISKESMIHSGKFIPGSEALSHILLPERSLAIVTIIQDNKIVIWDYVKNNPLHILDLNAAPRGIALSEDRKKVYISMIRKDKTFIREYSVDNLVTGDISAASVNYESGNGSHLTMVYRD